MGTIKTWFVLLHLAVITVSMITATFVFSTVYFPMWFRLLFFAGTFIFCGLLIINLVAKNWLEKTAALKRSDRIVWLMMWLSFVAVAAVHQFYLFRPDGWIREFLLSGNTLINVLGLVAVPLIYRARKRLNPTFPLLVLASVALIPNDDCRNPFNEFWLSIGTLSPMMFVPNVAVILFSLPMLKTRPNFFSLAVIATAIFCTFLLGLGHITRFIW